MKPSLWRNRPQPSGNAPRPFVLLIPVLALVGFVLALALQSPPAPLQAQGAATPTPTMTMTITSTTTVTPTLQPGTCRSPIDIMLVLDGSGSISSSEFRQMKTFANDLVNSFTIGPADARIGIVQFSWKTQLEIALSDDQAALADTINNLRQFRGGTDIQDGLEEGRTELARNGRSGTPQVIILLTDGYHNRDGNPQTEAQLAKNAGVTVFTIAVGNSVNRNQINGIASDPDSRYVFSVSNFAGLQIILQPLVIQACLVPTPTPTATIMPSVTPSSTATPTASPTPTSTPQVLVPDVQSIEPPEGFNDEATDVLIAGDEFAAGARVQFAGPVVSVDLNNVVVSDTMRIAATVLAGLTPGIYDVVVTNPNGQEGTLPNGFTILARVPKIDQVVPSFGYNDIENEINVFGANFADGAVVSVGTTELTTTRVSGNNLRAIVPAGLPTGTYPVGVANPGSGQAQADNAYTVLDSSSNNDLFAYGYELWVNPVVPRAGEEFEIGVFVRRQGGKEVLENVGVRFTRDSVNGTVLGTTAVPFLDPPGDVESTPAVNATFQTSGTVTLYAIIDPDNLVAEDLETNNVVSRTVTIAPPGADQSVPVVTSILVNGGSTDPNISRDIAINVTATDPDPNPSGVEALNFIEFVYNVGAQQWIPVGQSNWLPYASGSVSYTWTLQPTVGMHYVQVRARDRSANISIGNAQQVANYEPTVDRVNRNQTRLYRFDVAAGESLVVDVETISGDPDLYVWSARTDQSARVSNRSDGNEQIVVPTAEVVPGVYQVEIFGFSTATYRLSVRTQTTVMQTLTDRLAQQAGGIDQTKDLPTEPILPVANVPDARIGTVPPFAISQEQTPASTVYLPLLIR